MRKTRDTFLHFLSDNLTGVPLHTVRADSSNPSMARYQTDAVNVKFLDVSPNWQIGSTLVEIAVIANDELDALTWVQSVYALLSSAYYTPKLDYTNPANPVATGTNIYWDVDIKFRTVLTSNDFYYDYRCLLTLRHKIDS